MFTYGDFLEGGKIWMWDGRASQIQAAKIEKKDALRGA
jgi:hypothetical protein